MLVLSRKPHESVRLELTEALPAGTVINVRVVRLGPNTARLGLEAPKSINIAREELLSGNEPVADRVA